MPKVFLLSGALIGEKMGPMKHLKRHRFKEQPGRYIPDILISQVISIVGGLAAGSLLGHFRGSFEPVAGFLLLLPGTLNLPGDIQGSLAARIHHHILRWPSLRKQREPWRNNIIATFLLVLVAGGTIGVIATLFSTAVYRHFNVALVGIGIVAALISNLILTPIVIRITTNLYDAGHDPDNIVGPLVTSLGDFIAVLSLAFGVFLFG